MLKITQIINNSIGMELGISAGDSIAAFNNVPVRDALDYFYYDGQENFVLSISDKNGEITDYEIEKYSDESLGLCFLDEIETRSCCNNCMFCFVEQLPEGMRNSLYVKDDDWRLSFISGNYVTLTNLKKGELERIIEQNYSPIYISVHATDLALRKRLLGIKKDCDIMPLIKKLSGGGIEIHAQAVICPGINDGINLEHTIEDLSPYVSSLAVVPVGLSKFSNPEIIPFDALNAAATLDIVDKAQKKCFNKYNTKLVFAADELYLLAGRKLPDYNEYEDFAQIENGIGMCAKLEQEIICAASFFKREKITPKYKNICIATGTAAFPLMSGIADKINNDYGTEIKVREIYNDFFGHSINVAGLITGGDLIRQLRGVQAECIIITKSMLKEFEDVFLDGISLSEAEKELGIKIIPVSNDGEKLLGAILGVDKAGEY